MSGLPHQDWNYTVLRKPTPHSGKPRPAGAAGGSAGTGSAAPKPAGTASTFGVGHLNDAQPTTFHVQTVGHNFKMALQKARVAKNLKQTELAMKLNVKVSVIQSYESGTAQPNPQLIQKMNRILGVTLPKPPKVKNTYDEDY